MTRSDVKETPAIHHNDASLAYAVPTKRLNAQPIMARLRDSVARAPRTILRLLPPSIGIPLRDVIYRVATFIAPDGDYAQRYRDYQRATRVDSPPLAGSAVGALLSPLLQPANDKGLDIVVFPIIDWHFRIQRPQHIAMELARAGNRVFYLATTFLPAGEQPTFAVTESPEQNVFLCKLSCPSPHPVIYSETLLDEQLSHVAKALDALLVRASRRRTVAVVGHAFWCNVATSMANTPVIYDCMDYHAGFPNVSRTVIAKEEELLRKADAVVVSSQMLSEHVGAVVPNTVIRNAADVEFFGQKPIVPIVGKNRPTVGYVGAIAEWFDVDLIAYAARRRPEWRFVLIGSSAGTSVARLRRLPNVELLGELPYTKLPDFLHSFDVCTIPFKLTELIMHTNPVKIYEYLSAGKPVVATVLPELQLLENGLVHLAANEEEFLIKLEVAMGECADLHLQERRVKWASAHTWESRADEFATVIENILSAR